MHRGPLQGSNEILIEADPASVFSVLEDGSLLPQWMPPVISTTAGRETVGAVRECQVEMGGRAGTVVERCIESIPPKQISWALERDTLGFGKMLNDFSFSFVLKQQERDRTLLTNETYYQPRNVMTSLMNLLVLKRKFSKIRMAALKGIKKLVEERRRDR
ncbi:MAG TPA: SRPBCC family protein [Xanthobacteraceae bacterium]|nr:SRPBCC family protein [Xanthobacteraceae bacterium]